MSKSKPIAFLWTVSLSVLLNLLIKPLWVLTENKVQDFIGHESMGAYAAMFSLTSMFLVIADMGISNWCVKQFAGKPLFDLSEFSSVIWGTKFVLSLIFMGWTGLLAIMLGYEPSKMGLLALILLYQVGISFLLLQRSYWQSLQKFKTDAVYGNLDKFIALVGVLFLFYFQTLRLNSYIVVLLVSIVLPLGIGFVGLKRYVKFRAPQWRWSFVRQVGKLFLPYAFMTVLFSVNERFTQVWIEQAHSEYEAGLFAGAYRWTNAIAMYLWTILPIFFAKFAALYEKPQETQRFFQIGWLIVSLPIIFVACWVQVYGEILFMQFGKSKPEEIAQMAGLLKVLIWTVALNATFNIFSTWLTATSFIKQTNIVLVLSLLINVTVSYIFVPKWGSWGGAWALLTAFTIQSLGFLVMFLKHKNFFLDFFFFLKSIICLVSAISVFYVGVSLEWHVIINSGLPILVMLVGVYYFRLNKV